MLEKAREVFWSLGYSATSLDDIARATGLNRPSLYAAFGDKHALYMAALNLTRTRAGQSMGAVMGADGPLRPVLSRLLKIVIAAYTEGETAQRGCFIIGTAVTQAVDDPDARALASGFVADEDAIFRERFARAAPGELAPGMTAEAAAVVATAALHTLAIRARIGDGQDELTRVAEATVNAICGPG